MLHSRKRKKWRQNIDFIYISLDVKFFRSTYGLLQYSLEFTTTWRRLEANAVLFDRSIVINYIVVVLNARANCRGSNRPVPRYTPEVSSRIEVIRESISRFPEDIAYLPCGKDYEPDRPIAGTWPRSRSIIPARYLSSGGARGQAAWLAIGEQLRYRDRERDNPLPEK